MLTPSLGQQHALGLRPSKLVLRGVPGRSAGPTTPSAQVAQVETHSTKIGTILSQSKKSEAISGSQLLVYPSSCFQFILQSYVKITIYGFQFIWMTTFGPGHTKE
ncbi:hypothetical protein Ahy_A03g012898 isoform A [Arachis hypogaea]|uniref:Uncharacterized protein n=1 Tax=Arachis hypogaea TaxID=3818 RepID=A0A445DUD1_ARAHY|nr:hypothetical protein Ahy_A03g012898 isoform A [Arachis hypogaea]